MITPYLSDLPNLPGIYTMFDRHGRALYVGKAVKLRVRVRSYFSRRGGRVPKVASLMRRVRRLMVRVTGSELAALLDELSEIRRLRPPFNVQLKEPRRSLYVVLGGEGGYPSLVAVRELGPDPYRTFGPVLGAGDGPARDLINAIRKVVPLRVCQGPLRARPCLDRDLGMCSAPCRGGGWGRRSMASW